MPLPRPSEADRLFALSQDLLCLVGVDGYFKQVNPAFERTLGWSAEELFARPFYEFVHPDDRDATNAAMARVTQGMAPRGTENRYRCKDGSYRWISWRTSPPDEDGLLYAIGRDVSAQKAIEAERHRTEDTLRRQALVVEVMHDAVVVTDVAGNVVDWSPSAERTFGYTRAEMLGRSAECIYPPDAAAAQHAAIATGLAAQGRWTGELRIRRKDGTEGWCETVIAVLRGPDGQPVGGVGVNRDVTDRKRVEAALRESEEQYRRLVESAHEGICMVDADGRITYANARLAHMLGRDAAWLAGRTLFDVMAPEVAAEARSRFAHREGDSDEASEVQLLRADGGVLWVLQSASALVDTNGAFIGAVYVMSDVTARIEAQRRLEARERLFRALAEHSSELVSVIDPAGVITYANPAWVELLGYTPEDARGLVALDLVHPEDLPAVAEVLGRLMCTPGAMGHAEYRTRRRDGTWRVLRSVGQNFLDDPAVAGVVVNSRDVTDRRAAESALRRQNEWLQVIFDHMPAMLLLFDADGRLALVNRAWTRLLGWTLEEAQQIDVLAAMYPDPDQRAHAAAFIRAATGKWADFRVRVRDGRTLDTLWANVVLSDGSVVGIGRDVTEQRQLEAQFRQAQKMDAVGRLAAGVAHDFNNLLQVITGATLFAREQLPLGSDARRELAEIDEAANRAAALTRQLLAFGRRQVLQPERLDVNRVVTDVERMLRRVLSADVALVIDLQRDIGAVQADAGQLEQVLMNLVVNARDAMPEGGTLTIETYEALLAADAVSLHDGLEPGAYVALRVRDTGVGMDETTQAQMFEPFFTTKEPGRGTGLGLATVYGIVTQSGGRVQVTSAPGQGSTFTILLPMLERAVGPGAAAAAAPQTSAGRGKETILLVEHESIVREAVRRMLERGGYAVVQAGRAADALRMLEDPARRVDLVLSDMVMPDIGAASFVARLRERHASVRVLVMSGYGGDGASGRAPLGAEVEMLAKPFTPDELLRRVRLALDGAAAVRTLP